MNYFLVKIANLCLQEQQEKTVNYFYNYWWIPLTLIVFSPLLSKKYSNLWHGKTRVTSYELKNTSWNSKVWVQIYELRVQIYELRVQITSYGFKSTNYEFKSTSYKFKFRIYGFKFTSYEFKSTSYEFKSTS